MSDVKKKIRNGVAIATLAGGSLFAGSAIDRPECDFVLVTQQKEELCLSEKEAQVIIESVSELKAGFGSTAFEGQVKLNIKEK